MQPAFIVLGGLLLVSVFIDVFWTAMGEGGGPFTKRILSGLWKAFLAIRRRYDAARLFSFAGVIITVLAVALWIFLLWTGWVLVFQGAEEAVVQAQTKRPAGFWDRVYFVGFTIFTLGMGDYVPQEPVWEVLTALASISGLFLVTFSITYLVPIVQAARQKRQLAVYISSIGRRADDIILHTWGESDCRALGQHLPSLASDLAKLRQLHLTYPVLHYFHSLDRTEAVALRVAALDEALTIIEHGLEGYCVAPGLLRPARHAITAFLDTLKTAFIEPADDAPPPPSLVALRKQGLPVVGDAAFRARVERMSERRRLLLALVENDGWTWNLLQAGEKDR